MHLSLDWFRTKFVIQYFITPLHLCKSKEIIINIFVLQVELKKLSTSTLVDSVCIFYIPLLESHEELRAVDLTTNIIRQSLLRLRCIPNLFEFYISQENICNNEQNIPG